MPINSDLLFICFLMQVRFVCMSDTHCKGYDMSKLPPGDVFLHAGDFTMTGTVAEIKKFNDFLGKLTLPQ